MHIVYINRRALSGESIVNYKQFSNLKIQGRLVEKIQDRFMQKSSYSVTWDAERFGAGVYYIKFSTGENSLVRKAIIMK